MLETPRARRHARTAPLRPVAAGAGVVRRGGFNADPGLARAGPYGETGLNVDTAQPMRSWPYWFQIGLLPPVKEV